MNSNEKKSSVEVAIILNLTEPEVTKLYRGYWKLRGLDKLNSIHKETNGNTWPLWGLYHQLVKKKGMNIAQVVNVVETAIHKLPHMETLYIQAKDQAEKMQHTRQETENNMHTLNDEMQAPRNYCNPIVYLLSAKGKR